MAPMPAGRSIASLRAPRGTNFIRLAFAAVFLLGFLGLVGFLLKDYLPGIFPSLAGHDVAEETSKEAPVLPTQTPLGIMPDSNSASKLSNSALAEKSASSSESPVKPPAPIAVGFDPRESIVPKMEPAPERVATAVSPSSPAVSAGGPPPPPPPRPHKPCRNHKVPIGGQARHFINR
jgi:hypothetical protein